jgi:hypothetical protein
MDPCFFGGSFIYKSYRVGCRAEPYGTVACILLVIDISPSTQIPNFMSERNELMNLIMLAQNCNWENLYNKPASHVGSRVFPYPEIPQP